MMNHFSRRNFLKGLGISSATLPFINGLPSIQAKNANLAKKRLIIMFSPNGTLPVDFWPDSQGDSIALKPIMEPLSEFKDDILTLRGVHNKVGGDGDDHMKGIGCLLTGRRLHRGNIQGGGHTPAGWASGCLLYTSPSPRDS